MPAAADAGVQLAAELCEHPARVFADRERIIQVLTNLISNAIKFTPRGGHARVRVRCEPPNAVLEVEDDGHGIDSATMPLLFEPYRQGTERARAGLGLGLYIVRRLVDLHGGTVEVSSEGRDRGARLTVRLPLAPEEGNLASSGTVAAEDSEPDLEAVRVLVVDDDADSRDLFATVFASRGATVLSAGSAEQALAMLESCAADIVVSDLDMPGEDGFTLMRRIRANAPDLPAIAVSALASKNDAERARDAGYDLHLAKPVEAAELIARVSELASKRRDG
jgi:CheY-like chemotaxis protein